MEDLVMQTALSQFYKGKKIIVTGHTGFKGAWLAAWLRLLGADVKGYALAPEYENGLYQLLEATDYKAQGSVIGDIRERELLQNSILGFQPDIIFHLAAQPLVRRSYVIPADTFDVNVTGTANLLQSVTSLPGKCTMVVITTDKVYDNKETGILYKEEDALGGYDPYSASKACTELVVNSFRNSFFNSGSYNRHQKAVAAARAGNVIGGGDWSADRLIPDIVRSLQNKEEIPVRNPSSIRPWQHVLEPVCGYLQLALLLHNEPARFSRAFNFGPQPDDHLTVKQLVEKAISAWGSGEWKDYSDASQPHEASLLQLDISLAGKELNWYPKLNSADAIQWTIDWYRQPREQQAVFAMEQIKSYMQL